jgi:protein involved in polysaccharide export with SLBB domain
MRRRLVYERENKRSLELFRMYNTLGGSPILMVPFKIVGRRYSFLFAAAACLVCAVPSLQAQQSVTVGDTPQQVNDRIRTLTMGAHGNAPHDYVIGDGDLIEVSVFDVPELSKDLRVSQSGTISMPLVPVRLQVEGLTEIQAEQKITEVLEANGLVTHPQVSVAVKEHRSQPITVVGAVAHPMVYQADHEVTLLEVLAEAGGISNDAGDTIIITRNRTSAFTELPSPQSMGSPSAPGSGEAPALDPTTPVAPVPTANAVKAQTGAPAFPSADDGARAQSLSAPAAGTADPGAGVSAAGSTSITINLNDLLETGDMRNNIALHAGDVVTVPHAGIVYVLGAVSRPGGFVVSNDRTQLTTLKVLSLAGGVSRIAKLNHAVIIRKDDSGKQTETEIDLKKVLDRQAEDITMHASDILYIPDDRTKEVLLRAAEIGIAVGTAVAVFRLAYH